MKKRVFVYLMAKRSFVVSKEKVVPVVKSVIKMRK
jgi:hypothetical protein